MKINTVLPLTHGDRILYAVLGGLLLLSLLLPLRALLSPSAETVCVTADGDTMRCPMNRDADYTVVSRGCTLTVSVRGGGVSVTAADCPDRLCEKTGVIRRAGQSVVCLPACVVITVEGEDPDADIIVG